MLLSGGSWKHATSHRNQIHTLLELAFRQQDQSPAIPFITLALFVNTVIKPVVSYVYK